MVGSLHDRVLLSVTAQALAERRAAVRERIAPRATPLVAVLGSARGSVVTRRDDPAVTHDHGGDLALHAIGAQGHDAGDLHEVLVPSRPIRSHHPTLDDFGDCGLESVQRAAVVQRLVGFGPSVAQPLVRRISAVNLTILQCSELFEGSRHARASTVHHALVTQLARSVQVQEAKLAPLPQGVHLERVADRVDHVVLVGAQLAPHAVRKNGRAKLGAQTVALGDQVLAIGGETLLCQLFADDVGERVGLKPLALQQLAGNRLARAVGAGQPDDHRYQKTIVMQPQGQLVRRSGASVSTGPRET